MVSVGDFMLEDNIFPGSPGDSLLSTDTELDRLQRRGYQVAKHRPPAKASQPPQHAGEGNSSTCEGKELAKAASHPDKKSSCTKCSPPTKVCQESHEKDHSASKHQEKSQKDKEDSKSLHKHVVQCRDPPPCEQRRSLIWRILPRPSKLNLGVTHSMKQMTYSP